VQSQVQAIQAAVQEQTTQLQQTQTNLNLPVTSTATIIKWHR